MCVKMSMETPRGENLILLVKQLQQLTCEHHIQTIAMQVAEF